MPILLDIIIPLNQSRNKIILVDAEFSFDPREHYFTMYVFDEIIIFTFFFAMTGVDTMFLAVIHHFMGITSVIK